LPRDTVTYVPGVRGIYKLNAAINCADTLREGLEKTKSAAEWLLGGIRIDNYFAVDMNTMIMIGDAIGGIDFDLEMTYTGHSGKTYYSGMQHLDGTGITDYLRARTNATVNYTDIGRTNRQRQIMLAIFEKLKGDEDMLWNVLNTAIEMPDGFYTDITTAVLLRYAVLLSSILNIDEADIGMHVFTGPYRGTLEWNFTFTDQENRLSVIEEVYGVAAEPIPYVSSQYAQWLLDSGFSSVHYISVARELLDDIYAKNAGGMTAEQLAACQAFELAFRDAVSTFETAANTLSADDTRAMEEARKTLHDAGNAYAEAIGYSGTLAWAHNRSYWYDDTYINEYQVDWR
jgi:LCP family protein required for cell wall assembly